MAVLVLPRPLAIRPRFTPLSLVGGTALAILLLVVVFPILLIVVASFQPANAAQAGGLSIEPWKAALRDPGIGAAIRTTLSIVLLQQALSFPVAILIAWLLARTDLPFSRTLEFMFWVAFFLPALPVTLGWILLLDPQFGVINSFIASLFSLPRGPFDIYSFWGIVWVHVASTSVAVKVMLLTPSFRNMDSSLEEVARTCGCSRLGSITKVMLPVMTPTLVIVLVLAIIFGLRQFEVEAVLGPPKDIFIFSTKIYRLINRDPPLFNSAMALSTVILAVLVPLIVLQRWLTSRRSYAIVSGRLQTAKVRLRRWRLPALMLVLGIAAITTIVPSVFLLLGTFMKLFGFFNVASPWTLEHWGAVFRDPIMLKSLRNTLTLGFGAAVAGVAVCSVVGYLVIRTPYRGRASLDFISWLPSTLPGIILSLGLLWLFLASPVLKPLYGSMAALIVASVIASLTLGTQVIKSNLVQYGAELEEVARISGGSWWHTYRKVMLPLTTPVLLLVAAMSFVLAARDLSTVSLLATSDTRPLSLLQLDFMVEGRYEAAAVVGVLVVVITTGVALTARLLGRNTGIGQ
ncbi:MAG TPA: iron ABC transporter permease [Chloroflexota bacterium]|nr:iron ABC transporter permease [Chloroflexota bacterium]